MSSNQDIPFAMKPVQGSLDGVVASVRRVAARTVNDVAFDARTRIQARMRAAFDRPTPGVLRSVIVTRDKADGSSAVVSARVALTSNDAAFANRLAVLGRLEEQGGTLNAGDLGRKRLVVPTGAMQLNQYGALNRGVVRRLLDQAAANGSGVGRLGKDGRWRTSAGKFAVIGGVQVFAGTINGTYGLYSRQGEGDAGRVSLLAVFKTATTYKPRLQWQQTAEAAWSQVGAALKARLAGRAAATASQASDAAGS